jgi:D-2-hydroxyacid dehydrogenase (NADP+)
VNILLLLGLPEKARVKYPERLKREFPGFKVDCVDHHTKVGPYIGEAELLITFGPNMSDAVLQQAPRLKWIQALGTGVDGICDQPSLRKDVLVTNMRGVHGESMSEAALMSMLALARDLPRNVRNQARGAWERWPVRLISGKTVGILGVGAIAEALAPRCKALGMTVLGISSGPRVLPGFDRMAPKDRLAETVRELDYLVLLTPYSRQTHHLVDARILGAMKRGSFLVNLARGGVVDEAALMASLDSGHLAGAALDVFAAEPLPPDNPLWSMPNVIITPHLGGFHDEYADKALPVIIGNIRSFLAGDTAGMQNRVQR